MKKCSISPRPLLVFLMLSCGCCTAEDETSSRPSRNPTFNITIHDNSKPLTVPIELSGNNMCMVDCRINKKPAKLIVDTACGTYCLFENKLAKFGVKEIGVGKGGYTAAGARPSRIASKFVIEFPGVVTVECINGVVIPKYDNGNPIQDNKIDGLFGSPLLIHLKAVLDYRRKEITFNVQEVGEKVGQTRNDPR